MYRIQLKIICPIKNQENHNSKVKRKSKGTDSERYQILEFSEKNFKATIKKCSNKQL